MKRHTKKWGLLILGSSLILGAFLAWLLKTEFKHNLSLPISVFTDQNPAFVSQDEKKIDKKDHAFGAKESKGTDFKVLSPLGTPTPGIIKEKDEAPQEYVVFSSFSAPTVYKYRAEVEANLHDTPPSLIAFAKEVSKSVQRAKNDLSVSLQVKQDLAMCAQDTKTPSVVRAFCKDALEVEK